MLKNLSFFYAAFLLLAAAAAGQVAAPSETFSDRAAANIREKYVLGPDDVVTIHVPNAPDISEKPFRLEADGQIKLPMVGRIQAGGLTVEQLELEVSKKLKLYLEQPEVTISITEFKSQPVSILGAVANPGVHQIEGNKTLLEILAVAGGLRPDAGPTVAITRNWNMGAIPGTGRDR